MKTRTLLICAILVLQIAVFSSGPARAEAPIEIRILSMPFDSIADSGPSCEPHARFAINRGPTQGTTSPDQATAALVSFLQDNAALVPVSASTISRNEDGSIAKTSFQVLSVSPPSGPQAQASPVFVIVGIAPDLTGELSIQFTSYGGEAGRGVRSNDLSRY